MNDHPDDSTDDDETLPPPPYWGIGMTLFYAIGAYIASIIFYVVGANLAVVMGYSHETADTGAQAFGAYAVGTLGVFAFVLMAVRARRGAPLGDYLRLRPPTWRAALLGPLAIVIAYVFIRFLSEVLLGSPSFSADDRAHFAGTDQPLLYIIAIVVCKPIMTELLWRGFILRGLSYRRDPHQAAALCTFLWALSVLPWIRGAENGVFQIVDILVEGAVLSYAWLLGRSLLLCIALHAIINLLFMAQLILSQPAP